MGAALSTRTSEYTLRDDGIIVQRIVTGGRHTLDDARENTRTFERLAAGEKHPLLVDMAVSYALEPKAREHYATPEASRLVTALALITPSTTTRIIGNFFLALNQPSYPCRMFSTIDDAVAWIKQPRHG